MALPKQETTDYSDPRQHLAWIFPGLPFSDGGGMMTHPKFYADWSEHCVKAGAVHVDYLRSLANEDGYIHVDQLPKQQIERHPPTRGEDHWLNPTGKWVPFGTPRKPEQTAPNMNDYTAPEQAAVLEQMVAMGKFTPEEVENFVARGMIRPEKLAPEAFRMPDPVIDTSAMSSSTPTKKPPKKRGGRKK
ncbi:DUF2744 domain-containing protein [Gordonia bronchialis]|uniref:phage gene 29 protein family protein n=1 Tax=Gordonia bronchialis TaxID=2054 RepID=UPI001CBCB98F|nr:DUF2744 domain-containing protein [Gordonia bronchialis]UAK38453.1 DUF2744 domain-containing protein [Gordonia bronchialis]